MDLLGQRNALQGELEGDQAQAQEKKQRVVQAEEQVTSSKNTIGELRARLSELEMEAEGKAATIVEEYKRSVELQKEINLAASMVYLDGFDECKSIITKAYPQLDLSEIEPQDPVEEASAKAELAEDAIEAPAVAVDDAQGMDAGRSADHPAEEAGDAALLGEEVAEVPCPVVEMDVAVQPAKGPAEAISPVMHPAKTVELESDSS